MPKIKTGEQVQANESGTGDTTGQQQASPDFFAPQASSNGFLAT